MRDDLTLTPDSKAADYLLAERRRDGKLNVAAAVCPAGHRFSPTSPEALHVAWHGPDLLCPRCAVQALAKLGVPTLDLAPNVPAPKERSAPSGGT